jgi:hypothetical protein
LEAGLSHQPELRVSLGVCGLNGLALTRAGEFDFKLGFGLITGANEQGKSLIIEVVRWCLFGSAALRGKAEDYKTLRGDP